mmetsp:Transcript_113257/g.283659  ORF Transcript_113257/g.283659 Transcript_113257/m.283659 type:complete len:206 (-) Transcript_113257:237-854(-)
MRASPNVLSLHTAETSALQAVKRSTLRRMSSASSCSRPNKPARHFSDSSVRWACKQALWLPAGPRRLHAGMRKMSSSQAVFSGMSIIQSSDSCFWTWKTLFLHGSESCDFLNFKQSINGVPICACGQSDLASSRHAAWKPSTGSMLNSFVLDMFRSALATVGERPGRTLAGPSFLAAAWKKLATSVVQAAVVCIFSFLALAALLV